jgi:hypothetical protein
MALKAPRAAALEQDSPSYYGIKGSSSEISGQQL